MGSGTTGATRREGWDDGSLSRGSRCLARPFERPSGKGWSVDDGDQEIIFEELPGYTLKGKLLRATRVVVAHKPE